jgi:hypothetical protein
MESHVREEVTAYPAPIERLTDYFHRSDLAAMRLSPPALSSSSINVTDKPEELSLPS